MLCGFHVILQYFTSMKVMLTNLNASLEEKALVFQEVWTISLFLCLKSIYNLSCSFKLELCVFSREHFLFPSPFSCLLEPPNKSSSSFFPFSLTLLLTPTTLHPYQYIFLDTCIIPGKENAIQLVCHPDFKKRKQCTELYWKDKVSLLTVTGKQKTRSCLLAIE